MAQDARPVLGLVDIFEAALEYRIIGHIDFQAEGTDRRTEMNASREPPGAVRIDRGNDLSEPFVHDSRLHNVVVHVGAPGKHEHLRKREGIVERETQIDVVTIFRLQRRISRTHKQWIGVVRKGLQIGNGRFPRTPRVLQR